MAQYQGPVVIPAERRGGILLCYEGYRFHRNKIIPGRKIYWRCAEPQCRVPLQTDDFVPGGNITVLNVLAPVHNHGPDDDRLNRARFIQAIKDVISDDPSLPIRRAYDSEFMRLPARNRLEAPSFNEIRSTLNRHRATLIPPIPANIGQVDIQGAWAQTWGGARKLLSIDNQLGVVVFASQRELEVLSRCTQIFIDGTFRSAPHPYSQIVTIHGNYLNWRMPLAMALLTGKRQEQYRAVLRVIQLEIFGITHRPFAPTEVVTDFEIGLINAIHMELPLARTYGCYFHFTQSIMRRVAELGLKGAYQQDPDVQQIIRRMLGLGYLPPAHVRICFVWV